MGLILYAFGLQGRPAEASALTHQDLVVLATAEATANDLNVNKFLSVIDCESHWDMDAVSSTHDHGIAQINLRAHREISLANANDPYWALQWMAEQWKEHKQSMWSCYNKYKKQGWPTG